MILIEDGNILGDSVIGFKGFDGRIFDDRFIFAADAFSANDEAVLRFTAFAGVEKIVEAVDGGIEHESAQFERDDGSEAFLIAIDLFKAFVLGGRERIIGSVRIQSPSIRKRSAASAAACISFSSAVLTAIGFSHRTCFPDCSA